MKKSYNEDEVEYAACPLCGADRPRDLAVEWSLMVSACSVCGMRYARRRLREPDQPYKSGTGSSALAKYGAVISGQIDHPRERNYQHTLDRLEPYRGEGLLLDVGPHIGFFMRAALARGWSPVGVEPSPILSSLAREKMGLDVRTGYLGEVSLDQSFDVVTFTDVLEHVPDPISTLRAAREVLKVGGVVLAKVPHGKWNHAKYRTAKRVLGDRMDAYDAREHLLHFTKETLEDAFERAGFEPLEFFIPPPIQAGSAARRGARSVAWHAGNILCRVRGTSTFLSPDLVLIGRRAVP